MEKVIILGSGPAGLTAAIYAARAYLDPLVIEGNNPGGQLMGTTKIENWPGEKSIMGPQLMENIREHAKSLGVRFMQGAATAVNLEKNPFSLTVENKHELSTKSLIIATGAEPKKLKVPGEKEYWGKGVTTCAVCDGMFYKDKPVVIVGGGDTAMENASYMLNYTNKINIVQIMPELTACASMQARIKDQPGITTYLSSTVTQIEGDGNHVTGVTITNKETGKTTNLPVEAVFISIGFLPNTAIFKGQLPLDDFGYLKVTNHTSTSVKGVFAAGDVSDFRYRQAITAAGGGCMAGLDVEKFLKES